MTMRWSHYPCSHSAANCGRGRSNRDILEYHDRVDSSTGRRDAVAGATRRSGAQRRRSRAPSDPRELRIRASSECRIAKAITTNGVLSWRLAHAGSFMPARSCRLAHAASMPPRCRLDAASMPPRCRLDGASIMAPRSWRLDHVVVCGPFSESSSSRVGPLHTRPSTYDSFAGDRPQERTDKRSAILLSSMRLVRSAARARVCTGVIDPARRDRVPRAGVAARHVRSLAGVRRWPARDGDSVVALWIASSC
jgi:hypothetical protein